MKRHSRDYILQKTIDYTNLAFFRYQPQPVQADVVHFSVTKHPRYYCDGGVMSWSGLVKGHLQSFSIDCFHKNIMKEPNVSVVGQKLRELLLAAQARG
jgi:thioesterase domain-containing protein